MVRSYGVVIAVLLASAQAAIAGELNPKVVVTTPPLKPYVDVILRGIGPSESLLRPGQDTHTFTLSPSQRRMLAEADIILLPDRAISPVLDKLLASEEKRGAKVIELTALPSAKALPYSRSNYWLEGTDSDHAHADDTKPALDPHVWLDPMRMADLALPVADGIATIAPSHRSTLRENARDLAFHLREEVTPGVEAILAGAPRHQSMSARPQLSFITYHAAYQYFLKRFKLEPMGQITQRPENYLGAKTMHDVVAGGAKYSIRCIISETNSPLVQRIAKASGARIVPLSPEALYGVSDVPNTGWARNDYDRLLVKTAHAFAECL